MGRLCTTGEHRPTYLPLQAGPDSILLLSSAPSHLARLNQQLIARCIRHQPYSDPCSQSEKLNGNWSLIGFP